MNPVFLDTVGMIAVWDDNDQWHAGAKAECGNAAGSIAISKTSPELTRCAISAALVMRSILGFRGSS